MQASHLQGLLLFGMDVRCEPLLLLKQNSAAYLLRLTI
jgi:hypothetical protein